MNLAIREAAVERGITRLCHVTPSRNLVHIAKDPKGIQPSEALATDSEAVFNPIDQSRLDGFPDHVCCSIQYPNAWYLNQVRQHDAVFRDWTILLIKPDYLWLPGTKFSPRNAAAGFGSTVSHGTDAFASLFANETLGARGRTFVRSAGHPTFLPTDQQAEVLIPTSVARKDIAGIVVPDESQAKREIARLETLGVGFPHYFVAPDLFDAQRLSSLLRSGSLPCEVEYDGASIAQ